MLHRRRRAAPIHLRPSLLNLATGLVFAFSDLVCVVTLASAGRVRRLRDVRRTQHSDQVRTQGRQLRLVRRLVTAEDHEHTSVLWNIPPPLERTPSGTTQSLEPVMTRRGA